MLRSVFCAVALLGAGPAAAAPVDDLMQALRLPEIIEIMREEGLAYGDDLAADLIPGGADAAWRATVARLYDPLRMQDAVRAGFAETLDGTDLAPLLRYFEDGPGARIVTLEVSARRAMVDEDVEEAAREAFRDIDGGDDPRLGLLDSFVEANDLVDSNVSGALNASFQFYRGLADGGAFALSEQEMLADVWEQEPETRADTREWVYAFLLLAYGPLEDEALADYIAFSSTPEGQVLNRALFRGFNDMYDAISYALGLAAAREMQAKEL